MLCKWCNTNKAKKTFCSHPCRNAWTSHNNKTNNPIWNEVAREKMRQSLTGKIQSDATKRKRAAQLRDYYDRHPQAKARLTQNVWDKYTSKIAGTGWTKIRLKVLERDGHECQDCGEAQKRLVVHRLDWKGKRRGVPMKEWNNSLNNLKTLCIKCHNNIHRHKSSDYQLRLKKSQGILWDN